MSVDSNDKLKLFFVSTDIIFKIFVVFTLSKTLYLQETEIEKKCYELGYWTHSPTPAPTPYFSQPPPTTDIQLESDATIGRRPTLKPTPRPTFFQSKVPTLTPTLEPTEEPTPEAPLPPLPLDWRSRSFLRKQ